MGLPASRQRIDREALWREPVSGVRPDLQRQMSNLTTSKLEQRWQLRLKTF